MYIDTTQEELLRERLRCGDKEALFSLMIIYYNDLFKYALKFTSDPELTKDLVNQFFIHVWENRANLYKAEKIKPYLIVSFKRFLLAWYRKEQKHTFLTADDFESSEQPYENYLIAIQKEEQIKEALKQAVKSLPKRQKELVQLRFYEQLSYEEISERTSLTIRTIYNKLHIALKKMRSNKLLAQIRKF